MPLTDLFLLCTWVICNLVPAKGVFVAVRAFSGLMIASLFFFGLRTALSQKEGLIWYFGDHAGLDFREGSPKSLDNSSLYTIEGCATISDTDGNLLFYTDGIEVYNRNHQRMPNGFDLYGDPSSTQSGVIVPIPNDSTRYFIFTVDNDMEQHGLCYSMVDLTLDDGLGDVDPAYKNRNLLPVSTERITSVKHQNDFGVWVIVHEWMTRRFRSYLITNQGFSHSDYVISDVGIVHGDSVNNGKGYMKVSVGGEKVAVAVQGKNLVQVFDFDNETGLLSNPVTLTGVFSAYGVEFSADARHLYASERYGNIIHQWDLEAGDQQDIIGSHQVVGILNSDGGGAMQMASDGKIYIARKSKLYLSVIADPSLPGTECGFSNIGVWLDDNASKEGLPTFIQSFFNFYWINYENYCQNDTIFFSLNKTNNIDSLEWNFGDPESGVHNTSHDVAPWHIYTAPGEYEVFLRIYHISTFTDVTTTVEVLPLPEVSIGSDTVICDLDTIRLNAGQGFSSYMWMDDPVMNDTVMEVCKEGMYWVEVTNMCGMDQDTIQLDVNPLPGVDLGNDTVIKYSTYITLNAGTEAAGYEWQDGSTSSLLMVDYPGSYWVEVSDEIGCKASDTIMIEPITFGLNLPNAFTPNGDMVNDVFRAIPTYEVEMEFRMMVFNRWGELVFESTDIRKGWNGNCNGMPCAMDVYVWVVDAETFEENEFFSGPTQMKGSVTLLR